MSENTRYANQELHLRNVMSEMFGYRGDGRDVEAARATLRTVDPCVLKINPVYISAEVLLQAHRAVYGHEPTLSAYAGLLELVDTPGRLLLQDKICALFKEYRAFAGRAGGTQTISYPSFVLAGLNLLCGVRGPVRVTGKLTDFEAFVHHVETKFPETQAARGRPRGRAMRNPSAVTWVD